jgi:voltage-gated potassium channel
MKKKKLVHKKMAPSWQAIFEDPDTPYFYLVHNVLAAVTLVAVAVVALESVTTLSQYIPVFHVLEYIAVAIFTIEYGLRLYLAPKRFRYIFSFFGVIDLLATVPSFLGLSNLTFLKAARIVRIIRLLRLLRLAKFAKIKRKKHAARSLYTINLEIYLVALMSALLILGALLYVFEDGGAARDIPSGMYWALKVILGGISYPQPETLGGTVVIILARFTSMLLLGMLLSLVGTMLRKLLIGSEKDSD